MTRRSERLLAELEERRQVRATLKAEAEAKDEHTLAMIHSVAQDAYADAFVLVAAALPTIVSEATESLESWTPGELVEAYGR